MSAIKIEKNVPVPADTLRSPLSKAMRSLKVGESFKVDYTTANQTSAHVNARRFGIGVKTRRTDDGMLRVWRVK